MTSEEQLKISVVFKFFRIMRQKLEAYEKRAKFNEEYSHALNYKELQNMLDDIKYRATV